MKRSALQSALKPELDETLNCTLHWNRVTQQWIDSFCIELQGFLCL